MKPSRSLKPRDLRELQRIKIESSQRKIGNVIGQNSEDFFERVLTKLLQQGKIEGFKRTPKWSPDDRGGTDFFITDLDGKEHRVDVKSSKTWIIEKRPGIAYIIIGLNPSEKKTLKQLRKYKIIPRKKEDNKNWSKLVNFH